MNLDEHKFTNEKIIGLNTEQLKKHYDKEREEEKERLFPTQVEGDNDKKDSKNIKPN